MSASIPTLQKRIKILILFFIVGLVISGITAFPIQAEIHFFETHFINNLFLKNYLPAIYSFLVFVSEGVRVTAEKYPFLFYGTDWLAFAHIVIGIAFFGPLKDPVKNIWVIEWGMIACVIVVPLAFICGPLRGIPFTWRLIDCSFGLFGILPLWLTRNYILQLERLQKNHQGIKA